MFLFYEVHTLENMNYNLLKESYYALFEQSTNKLGNLKNYKIPGTNFENKNLFNFLFAKLLFLELRFRRLCFRIGKEVRFFLGFFNTRSNLRDNCSFPVKKKPTWGNVLRTFRATSRYLLSFSTSPLG